MTFPRSAVNLKNHLILSARGLASFRNSSHLVPEFDLWRFISFLTTLLAGKDGKAAAALLAVSKVTQLGESKGRHVCV